MAFDSGFTHYDEPPPVQLGDISELRAADRFRFANLLRAWIEVDIAGQITAGGYGGSGLMGASTVRLGGLRHTFQAAALPDLQRAPERGDSWMRFAQTTGGRTALPLPRPVPAPALRPVAGAAGVDHAVAHPARGRPGRIFAPGSQPVPPALDLWRRRPTHAQVGHDRLRRLAAGVVRPPYPMG